MASPGLGATLWVPGLVPVPSLWPHLTLHPLFPSGSLVSKKAHAF